METWKRDIFFSSITDIYKQCQQYRFKTTDDRDFTLNEVVVLVFLSEYSGQNTIKAISEQLNISKGLVSRSVESLRKRGLLATQTDADDRRKVLLTLLPNAQPYAQYFKERQESFDRRILRDISEQELETAIHTFQKMLKNIMEIVEEE